MQSTDPTFPLFPIMAFLGFVVSLIPLPWHLQAWNSGTCAFMIWTSLSCLVEFINSIIWAGNVNNNAPVWCDISSKFLLGAGVGITASILCTSRRLYTIASMGSSTSYPKRCNMIIDLCIALGIPILVMVLHYVVQPHRYDILEDIGCYAAVYNTLPAYFLVLIWPVLLGCISFVYSALTFRIFWKRRLQFAQLLSSNSSLSVSRYIRLMLLALTDMMLTVPLAIFSIFLGTYGVKLAPWISWEDVHYNFSRVKLVPAILWRSDPWFMASVELTRWLYVASAFIFFALFGFASESQKHYKDALQKCLRPFNQVSFSQRKWRREVSLLPSWRNNDTKTNTVSQQRPESTLSGTTELGKQCSFDKESDIKFLECDRAIPASLSPTLTLKVAPLTPHASDHAPPQFSWKSVSGIPDRRHSSYF